MGSPASRGGRALAFTIRPVHGLMSLIAEMRKFALSGETVSGNAFLRSRKPQPGGGGRMLRTSALLPVTIPSWKNPEYILSRTFRVAPGMQFCRHQRGDCRRTGTGDKWGIGKCAGLFFQTRTFWCSRVWSSEEIIGKKYWYVFSLVSPFISLIIVPYIIPYIEP